MKIACPLLRGTVPMVTVPFIKVTAPVGVPPFCGTTFAVNVTDCPTVEGFSDELNRIAVEAWLTTWLTANDVLAVKFVSPE